MLYLISCRRAQPEDKTRHNLKIKRASVEGLPRADAPICWDKAAQQVLRQRVAIYVYGWIFSDSIRSYQWLSLLFIYKVLLPSLRGLHFGLPYSDLVHRAVVPTHAKSNL